MALQPQFPSVIFPLVLKNPQFSASREKLWGNSNVQILNRRVVCMVDEFEWPEDLSPTEFPDVRAVTELPEPLGACQLKECVRVLQNAPRQFELRFMEVRFGLPPLKVSRILADIPIPTRHNGPVSVRLGDSSVQVQKAGRKFKDNLDQNAWDIYFNPPVDFRVADRFMTDLGLLLSFAFGAHVNWIRTCYHDDRGVLSLDVHSPAGEPSGRMVPERIYVRDRDTLKHLLNCAAASALKPGGFSYAEVLTQLNEIEKMQGEPPEAVNCAILALDGLVLANARENAASKNWAYSPEQHAITRRSNGVQLKVMLGETFPFLLENAHVDLEPALRDRLLKLRSEVLEGKFKEQDPHVVHRFQRAVTQLLVLVFLGLLGFKGRYQTCTQSLPLEFPNDVLADLQKIQTVLLK